MCVLMSVSLANESRERGVKYAAEPNCALLGMITSKLIN